MSVRTDTRRDASDASLVELARNGDLSAFDTLVKRFQRAVHAVAFAVLSEREASLDVLQESFIAAYRSIHELEDPSRFGPWVCGIARNKARQLRRSLGRVRSQEVLLPDVSRASAASRNEAGRIREALSALTDAQADAVSLHYMEGYSIRECAGILEVPEGTVKRRLHDARQRLKKEMISVVQQQLPQFALPEDYRVVIDKATPIHTTRPSLAWFKGRWLLIWQDGVPWEPYDGPWWYWLSESSDGKQWSEPRKLEMPAGSDAMRNYSEGLCLMNCCVFGDKLAFLTHQFAGHMDLYTSDDAVTWTAHPRFRMGMVGRGSLFSSGSDLYLTYCTIFLAALGGYRVELLRSTDGGSTWQWLNSPYWAEGEVHDCAGIVVEGRIYIAWRENTGKWTTTPVPGRSFPNWEHFMAMHDPSVPDGALVQRVCLTWSDNGGETWAHSVGKHQWVPKSERPDPVVVEPLDVVKPFASSGRLNLVARGSTMVAAHSVGTQDDNSDVQIAFSRDGGATWPEKAVYSSVLLRDVAAVSGPDGALLLAGSSRTGSEARPWVVHSRIER